MQGAAKIGNFAGGTDQPTQHMAKDKGFRSMNDLVSALAEAERGLAKGRLDLEALEAACADARELYERIVVLRHKAREAMRATTGQPAPPPPTLAKEPTAPVEATEPPPLRLDTRPPVVSPRQVSLIEAIEESGTPPEAAEVAPEAPAEKAVASEGKAPVTLAEKLEKASIPDLSKAISLSHKFWFVAELFGGDRIAYDKSIGILNALGERDKAMDYLEREVLSKLKKPADPEAVATFTDLIHRRFA